MNKRFVFIFILATILVRPLVTTYAQTQKVSTSQSFYNLPIDPIPWNSTDPSLSCPIELFDSKLNKDSDSTNDYLCASSYEEFLKNPTVLHYWVEDPAITEQGKADERARQFIYWVVNTNAVDEAPVLRSIWNVSSIIALFGIVIVAAIFGIGYILSTRTNYNFDFKIRIWPTVIKIGIMLLFVAFSSALVFILIQLSEVLMRFFYENLGGRDLFNIYFANPNDTNLLGGTEDSYKSFVGARDLNIRVNEGINAEIFMLKLTNVSYYVMGVMLLLRKVLLWFLLFVSPFLALLMPFILIRNTGWIWIGVFFQWLFYGPLVALFLGGMSRIWKEGIPFSFDFSRVADPTGYVYPTGINIVYGGPAQRFADGFNRPIGALNNANYIDTFAEYVITLIMLWAVTFFPWWLLRIFRDYCCEGIYAMKNILMALYDHLRGGPPTGPSPSRPPSSPFLKLDTRTPTDTNIHVSLGSVEQIRKTMTRDIAKSLNIEATHITDIARVETNKQMNQMVTERLTYLSNPVKASKPAERQQFMNLRSELFARAIKNDTIARTILASTSSSATEQARMRETLIRTLPQATTLSQVITREIHVPKEKVTSITNTYTKTITNNNQAIQSIAQSTKTSPAMVTNILQSYGRATTHPIAQIVKEIAKEHNTTEHTVREVLKQTSMMSAQSHMVSHVATVEKLSREQVSNVLKNIRSSVTRERSTLSVAADAGNIPPEQAQKAVTTLLTSVSQDKTLMEQVMTGLPPETSQTTVETILRSFTTHLDESASRLVERVALETKTDTRLVSSVLERTIETVQTAPVFAQTAQQLQVPQTSLTAMLTSIERPATTVSTVPAIQTLTQTAKPAHIIKPEQITHVLQELSRNEEIIHTLSQQTSITENQISQVLSSYTQNVGATPSDIVSRISEETQVDARQVTTIIQALPAVASTPAILNQVAATTAVSQPAIQHIVQTLPQTVTVSAPATKAESMISSSMIETIIQTAVSESTITTQIATETGIEQETVSRVLNSFATNLTEHSSQIVETVAQSTQLTQQQVQTILQSFATVSTQSQPVQTLTAATHIPSETVHRILTATTGLLQIPTTQPLLQEVTTRLAEPIAPERPVIEQLMQPTKETVTAESIQTVLQTIAANPTVTRQVVEKTNLQEAPVKAVLQTLSASLSQSPATLLQTLSTTSSLSQEEVQTVISTVSTVLETPVIQAEIAAAGQVPITVVENISTALPRTITVTEHAPQEESLVQTLSTNNNMTQETSQRIVTNLIQSAVNNTSFIQTLSEKHHLKPQQIKNILTTYSKTIDQPPSQIVATIHEASGIPKAQVQTILIALTDSLLSSDELITAVATEAGVEPAQVSDIMQQQLEFTSDPEKHIEKTIAIPQSISLEDYEEVKAMWTKQYEEGEVPVSDIIKTRTDWIEQEIVYITNTLNKILSPDEKLQQQGLDELGYLLPIFLINNLKGEELIVYLKAKLEAAKTVQMILEHEASVKEKIATEEEETLVDVTPQRAQEQPQALHMTLDEEPEQSIEDRVKAVQEKLETTSSTGADENPDLTHITTKLQEEAEKSG